MTTEEKEKIAIDLIKEDKNTTIKEYTELIRELELIALKARRNENNERAA